MAQEREHCRTMEDVAHYIENMRFRKKLFGGVDEADVWKKIEALHREYEAVFLAQEIRHEVVEGAQPGVAQEAQPAAPAAQPEVADAQPAADAQPEAPQEPQREAADEAR